MANFPVKLQLDPRFDKQGKKYYIAKLETPISIHCEKGIAFLVFTSNEGEEELHICPSENKEKKPIQVYNFSRQSTAEAEILEDLDKNKR